MDNKNQPLLEDKTLFDIMENFYQELFVTDDQKNIIYVNKRSLHNYGLTPETMIGRSRFDFCGFYFWPEKIPDIFVTKEPMMVEQVTATGRRILSSSNPVFRPDGTVSKCVNIVEETEDDVDLDLSVEAVHLEPSATLDAKEPDHQGIVAESMEMKRALYAVELAAKSQYPLLIQGESGTGKTLLAEYTHRLSDRGTAPFFSINCASIPEQLLESELFGYEPYAFTGANHKGKKGLVEQAKGGTLFLDEIGELAPVLQAKLLDLLEGGSFRRVGGSKAITADVRFVCATNQDLVQMIRDRRFREDLYWRINVLDVYLPPLRDRPADTALLIRRLLTQFNSKYQMSKTLSQEAETALLGYGWPGNVRELRNMMERLVIVSEHDCIQASDLPPLEVQSAPALDESLDSILARAEGEIVTQAHLRYPATKDFATALQVSESTARRLLKKYVVADSL